MKAKLGFSISTLVEPDILILDEILSVGDIKFKKKSAEKLNSMMKDGITVLLVSHSIPQIKKLCDRCIWIEDGKITYRLLDRNPDIAINKEHIANLGKFIPIVQSHWGNYWHFTSMPEIWRMEVFHDGCFVELRLNWHYGETIFIHNKTHFWKDKIEVKGYWQE